MVRDSGKYVSNTVPSLKHWAIITRRSITIPGDQRSRDAPGHGYPEHQEDSIIYQAYSNEAVWKEDVRECMNQRYHDWHAVLVIPASVEMDVKISVSE